MRDPAPKGQRPEGGDPPSEARAGAERKPLATKDIWTLALEAREGEKKGSVSESE